MKKITYNLLILAVLTLSYSSCKDDKLDPLQTDSISKGKLLALRGIALDKIYNKGVPAGETFPKIATSADKFVFEAEYLAEDPNSLQSVDFFVIKKTGSTIERVLVKNVPFSEFKNDGKYPRPWVEVTIPLTDVLSKLGLTTTFPLSSGTINTLLSTYKFGVPIEGDLNLTDGTKATADKVVAAGLFQSNQFYPAQKLNWAMTDYCSYVASSWAGAWIGTEVGACCSGDDNMTFTQDPANPNKFTFTNFWGDRSAATAYIVFTPSTKPGDQIVAFPDQTTGEGFDIVNSKGTYDQCKQTFTINTTYIYGAGKTKYNWLYVFNRP